MEIEASLASLHNVVAYLQDTLPEDAVIFLRGDLAAGKTTLTQAVAKAKGVDGEVTSPTFSIQHRYGKGLYHYDLYRLEHEAFMQMGLFEEFENPGWHFVEWGSDRLKAFLEEVGCHVCTVEIEPNKESRIYRIEN